jgi:hypothetical protein
LNEGIINATINKESKMARKETKMDSPMNVHQLPFTCTDYLRTPISLALLKERAVADS